MAARTQNFATFRLGFCCSPRSYSCFLLGDAPRRTHFVYEWCEIYSGPTGPPKKVWNGFAASRARIRDRRRMLGGEALIILEWAQVARGGEGNEHDAWKYFQFDPDDGAAVSPMGVLPRGRALVQKDQTIVMLGTYAAVGKPRSIISTKSVRATASVEKESPLQGGQIVQSGKPQGRRRPGLSSGWSPLVRRFSCNPAALLPRASS